MNFQAWYQLWRELKNKPLQQDTSWRLLRVVDQLGGMAKSLSYRSFYKFGAVQYNSEIKIAISDLLAMLIMFSYNEGFDPSELEKLGFARLENAIKEGRLDEKGGA